VIGSIAANIELASERQTLYKKLQSFPRKLYGIIHRAASIDQKDIFLANAVLYYFNIELTFLGLDVIFEISVSVDAIVYGFALSYECGSFFHWQKVRQYLD
jgi:hypothetical protein